MLEETRPWGKYEVLHSDSTFRIKKITVNPGKRLSLQRHKHRGEHWFITQGTALVTVDGADYTMTPGTAITIAVGQVHRIQALDQTVEFVEIQTGTYFGEDDIERLEDDFGRS